MFAVLNTTRAAVRRSGPAMAVTAFASLSARRSSSSTFAAKPTPSSSSRKLFAARPFLQSPQQQQQRGGSPSILARQRQSTLASSAATMETDTLIHQKKVDLLKSFDTTHPAYDVINKDFVSEYGAYCTLYRHRKSGAELLSVAVDDDNKVFGITLRTPPEDSTGVPHILEHSVLCGSRKYKTKDPFVHLLKGSLQTFLNAFTYPDRTCYVVASQNEKDFYNLVNVYADAVYQPRAVNDPLVLAQEGWHLELDDEGKLIYNGVVYNEMKGVYSSADSLLNKAAQSSLFVDNTYFVDSGGDPAVIPDLSFDQFKAFHEKHYHPSNSRIYFAGDDDVSKRLELMDEYLKDFDASEEYKDMSKVAWQAKTFAEPKREVQSFPAGADQPVKHMFMMNWLVNDRPLSSTEDLTLSILDHLLMGTTSSILRKTLMESGLGEAITGGGLSDELLQATYSVGLKGVEAEKVPEAEQLILDTLVKVAKEGFAADDIESSLNTIEFQMREFNTGSFPKYLSFMLGANSKWVYDESPTESLKFEKPLAELKASIAESGSKIFSDMMKEFLVENKHRTTVELVPSKTMEEEMLKEEKDRLSAIQAKMSPEEIEEVVRKADDLKRLQAADDSIEDRLTIPSLQLNDLKRETTEYPIAVTENESGSGVTVVRHELGSTSGIAYVNFAVDLSTIPLEDVPLIPLFTKMLKETGAGKLDSVALSRRIGTHTGGVDVGILTASVNPKGFDEGVVSTGENMVTKLMIQGKATSEKIDEMFSIYHLLLTEAKLDSPAKAIEMLKESKSRLESRIQGSGHSFANTRMSARYSVSGYIDEMMRGISYLDTVKLLIDQAENDWPSLRDRLERIRNTLLDESRCRSGMILDITGDQAVLTSIQPSVQKFLESLPGTYNGETSQNFYTDAHPWAVEAKKKMAESGPLQDEGFVVPTQVSYVGKAVKMYDLGERVSGSASVVARFLRTGYLWDRVRVMGGAYGGFCSFSPDSGLLSFLSYRDPNLDKTLDVYDAAADAVLEAADALENDPDALTTAIIGAIGDMDGALSPDQKGYTAFQQWIANESAEFRQKFRDEVLNTKPSDFRDFAERLQKMKNASVAVISSKGAFESANKAGKVMVLKEVI